MGFLKKLGRGIKKVVKKNKGGLTRLAKKVGPGLVLGAVTGGLGAPLVAKALSAGKSLGKKVKGLETPKSLVPIVRAATIARKKTARQKMPGGASMPHVPAVKVRSITRSTPQAKASLYKSTKKKKATGTKKPPSAKQLAARAKFAAAARARAKARKAA